MRERGRPVNFVTSDFKQPPSPIAKKSTRLFSNELSNLPALQCPSLYFESFPSTPTYTRFVSLCLFCPTLKVSLLHLVSDFTIWTECVLCVCCKQWFGLAHCQLLLPKKEKKGPEREKPRKCFLSHLHPVHCQGLLESYSWSVYQQFSSHF